MKLIDVFGAKKLPKVCQKSYISTETDARKPCVPPFVAHSVYRAKQPVTISCESACRLLLSAFCAHHCTKFWRSITK